MHMQHNTDTALLSNPRQYIGAFRPIMDVQNISPVQLFQQGHEEREDRLVFVSSREICTTAG